MVADAKECAEGVSFLNVRQGYNPNPNPSPSPNPSPTLPLPLPLYLPLTLALALALTLALALNPRQVRKLLLVDVPAEPSEFLQRVGRAVRSTGHAGLALTLTLTLTLTLP